MADKDAKTPRVYLIRHGETEWSQNGRYTGISDIPLLPSGEEKVRKTAAAVFGPGLLIDPSRVAKVFVSPRRRAQRTLKLLYEEANSTAPISAVDTTEDIAEWGYGDYEGLLTHQIRELRQSRGLDKDRKWDIWRDGTEGQGGESAKSVSDRLDRIIADISSLHGAYLEDVERSEGGDAVTGQGRDVLVIAHGHILRAFVKRWLGFDLAAHLELMLEPGGVCGLSYAHGNVNERAVLVGMSFPRP